MGRSPCCSKVGLQRGQWTIGEDNLLINYIQTHGEGHWNSLPKKAGLLRCGKSCRLRWLNYLRPDIRRGNITPDEDDLIIRLHSLLGNRWALIAGRLPGRTDNEIKNYWNCHLSKRLKNRGIDGQNNRKGASKSHHDGKTITKTKVYLPKAVKVSPFSITSGENGVDHHAEVLNSPPLFWSDLKDANNSPLFLACDKDSDFVYDYDYDFHPCQSSQPTNDDDHMLEKIYKEYQQLLKAAENQPSLDSFADSFFI